MRKTGRVRVVFSSGAQARGILREAQAMASAARLPVLFVEDGLKAEAERLSPRRNGKNAPASEYPTIPVDTQDVVAMYRVAHESIARARDGGGPTHIVGVRWKLKAGGRTRVKASSEDAVVHLERWLIARGLPAQEWRQEIVAEFEANGVERRSGALHLAETASEGDETETRAIA
jgi:pyruvate dehydrogenase E1 component alpha subunit